MDPDSYINIVSNKAKLINDIHECSKNIDNKTHKIESLSYYKALYEKLLTKYQSLLQDIEKKNLNKFNLAHYKNELVHDIGECTLTYEIGSKSHYEKLYESLSKLYSLVLDDIGATKLYFNYQKQVNSNSLFQLLYNLKKREDSSYNIEIAQKEFEMIMSPSFRDLTMHFQDIVKKNFNSRIYYRYYSNSNVTNHLSLEPFTLSK
ncbi:39385_t:CDS:1, partial [Gigaspora margarita]